MLKTTHLYYCGDSKESITDGMCIALTTTGIYAGVVFNNAAKCTNVVGIPGKGCLTDGQLPLKWRSVVTWQEEELLE